MNYLGNDGRRPVEGAASKEALAGGFASMVVRSTLRRHQAVAS